MTKKLQNNQVSEEDASYIIIHNVNPKSSSSLEMLEGTSTKVNTSSNQENYSIAISSNFTSFTGHSNNLQTKTTKNIISKA